MTLTTVIHIAQGVPASQTRITAVNVPKGVNAMTDETGRSVDAVIGGAIGPYGESKLKGAHDEHWTPAQDTGRHRAAVKENIMRARVNFHPLARLILGLLVLSTGAYGATPLAAASLPVPHAPILITKDSDFVTCGCVVAGDGSPGNPFQIGPWKIDDLSSGFAVRINNGKGGITKFFNLVGITSNPPLGAVDPKSAVISVTRVNRLTLVRDTTANAAGIGVSIDQSSHIRIDGSNLNKMLGHGHLVSNSSDIVVTNSKLKSEQSGMVLVNSFNVRIGADPVCAVPLDCNDFTYDEAYALLILNSHDVLVEGLNANAADTAGIVLSGKNTYDVEVRFSRASANGPICHTMQPSGLRGHTGLEVDHNGGIVLINGAHGNDIHENTVQANTGFDLRSGGDGAFVDPCTGAIIPVPKSDPMGSDNQFSPGANCYSTTNISPAPPKGQQCPGG